MVQKSALLKIFIINEIENFNDSSALLLAMWVESELSSLYCKAEWADFGRTFVFAVG